MKSDIEIAQEANLNHINKVAESVNIDEKDIEPYGHDKAKVSLDLWERLQQKPDGKLVLVTAITPTPAGEGKSTTTVGLGQALAKLGKKSMVAVREPSLGPSFGIKGGAAGGGYSQVVPMEDINLHFTGDIHAITTAHNLLSAAIDNHIHQGNQLDLDVRRITWKRVVDLNDRALRNVVLGLGGRGNSFPREDGFEITVASEIMAILCLAMDLKDLKERLSRIIVGYTRSRETITVADLNMQGSMATLLKNALKPNLVQTLENVPAFVHGGPFANIAHGCNSAIATKMGLKLSDYLVTEAGFGADLGAEKFFNIKSRFAHLHPDAAVVVATVRALKMHGGVKKDNLKEENVTALEAGFENLEKHVENVKKFGVTPIIAVNRFPDDTEQEINLLLDKCRELGARVALSEVFAKGGEGGEDLAKEVIEVVESEESQFTPLYDVTESMEDKIQKIAKEIYGAKDVEFTSKAKKDIEQLEKNGLGEVPVCMAKTQFSFSDDPKLIGRPKDFTITVKQVQISAGAGFAVSLTGDVMTMPGLPKKPAAEEIDLDDEGRIKGLF